MADAPQAKCQAKHPSEQTTELPREALSMDCETAMHRAKALFHAICELSGYVGVDNSNTVVDLASLGEAIMEGQLN